MKRLAKRKRLTKKQREQRLKGTIGLVVVLLIFISGYLVGRKDITLQTILDKFEDAGSRFERQIGDINLTSRGDKQNTDGLSQIHILDVGQGSSVLLIGKDDTTILIDTGRYDDSKKRIISYLDSYIGLGNKIDLLIFTHNDADHIGHGDLVLEFFDVKEVWMNGVDSTSKVYANVLDAILQSDAAYAEPKAGESFTRGDFNIEVLHPAQNSPGKDANDESIVTRIAFDDLSFMTSGDASIARENEIIGRGGQLTSNIMMLGHHGAANSGGEKWLNAVRPELVFYQAGANNSYGHPTQETLDRVKDYGAPVYGTDELGTISIYIDEAGEVSVETER